MKQRTDERMWTKTDAEDASRLLAELAKRAEKASGGFERPEKFQPEEPVPASSGKSGESERSGVARHDSPQLPVGQAGEKVAEERGGGTQLSRPTATRMGGDESGWVIAEGDGRIIPKVSRWVNANDNRPSNAECVEATDRAGLR